MHQTGSEEQSAYCLKNDPVLMPKGLQILVGEPCGPMLAAFGFPSVFKADPGIVYIDNMGVLCGIVNGSMSS